MRKTWVLILCFLLVLVVSGTLYTSTWAAPQTTIKYAVWDYSMNKDLQTAVAEFQKENPDIKVDIIDISNAEYSQKMTVMLAAGEDIDAFAIKNFMDYGGYIIRNYLAPLDGFVKKYKFNVKPYGAALNVIKEKNKLMALPWRSDIYILYYNKDLFDKFHIPYPTNDMTWQQVRDTAKKLTSGSGNEKTWGFFLHSWRSQVMNTILPTTKTSLVEGKYKFLKPAYQLFLGMQNNDKSLMSLAEIMTTQTHYRAFFESGKVGMVYMGTWYIASLLMDKHNVKWGVVKGPHWLGEKPGSSATVLTTAGINAKSTKKEAAWKFISFMGGEKGAKILASFGTFPAYRNPAVLQTFTANPSLPAGVQTALETANLVAEIPPHPQSAAIERTLQEEHNLIMTGQKPLAQGLKDMEKRVKELLEE